MRQFGDHIFGQHGQGNYKVLTSNVGDAGTPGAGQASSEGMDVDQAERGSEDESEEDFFRPKMRTDEAAAAQDLDADDGEPPWCLLGGFVH